MVIIPQFLAACHYQIIDSINKQSDICVSHANDSHIPTFDMEFHFEAYKCHMMTVLMKVADMGEFLVCQDNKC